MRYLHRTVHGMQQVPILLGDWLSDGKSKKEERGQETHSKGEKLR